MSRRKESSITSRERILAAFDHRESDRVPIDLGTSDTFVARQVYEGLAKLLGTEPKAAEGSPHPNAFLTPDEEMLEMLGADVRLVGVPEKSVQRCEKVRDPVQEEVLADGTVQWVYPDGQIRRRAPGEWDVQLYRPAMADGLSSDEIDRVFPSSPQAHDWADAGAARAEIARWHAEGRAVQCNRIIMPVTGTSQGALDFTSWCMALAAQPDLLCDLMDRYLEHAFAGAESFYRAVGDHMDMVYGLGDDVASHAAMWMSPADYRRYVKPRHAEIIRFIRARTQAKIIFHCCAACRAILPDLIEIGVDALNPTQTSAAGMDPFLLKRDFGDDITFWGGIDVMHLLREGTPQQVEYEVKRHIDALAPGGGYVLAPSHIIQRDCRPENVLMVYRTALTYGAR